jgi:MtrB/PioB family decaheme-associated outer membrane protein
MTTRTLAVGLFGALLWTAPLLAQAPAPAPAQPPAAPATPAATPAADEAAGAPLDVNLRSVDFGVRLTDISGDEARYNRYRDMRTGPVLQGFRWTDENQDRLWRAEADNVGYRDQRFAANFEQFGRFKGWFEYNQIPYEQDYSTRTPYSVQGDVLTVDDALQASIQGATATLNPAVEGFAVPFELRAKRDITTVGGQYSLGRSTDLYLAFTSTGRKGNQPWGGNFGMASTNEIPAPIDQRNNEIAANVEWSNRTAMFRAGYDGSIFNSDAESVTFDNPLRISSTPTLTSLGRMSRWPSSTMHTISATGSVALPAKSRLIGYVGQSAMASDVDLLPWTINPAIAQPALPRTSVDGDIDVTTVMLRFNSRPIRWLWLNANYRSYDLDNKTPPFRYDQKVSYDTTLVNSPGESSHPYSFNRSTLELDSSFTPWRNGAFRVGYVREDIDRTHRIYDTTEENSWRLGYDWTSNPFVTVRAGFLRQERRGKGFHPEILEQYAEQPGMRHADVSNRDRDAAQFVVTFLPTASMSLNVNGAMGNDDRPDGEFGLRSQDWDNIGFGVDYAPSDRYNLGASYLYEAFGSFEASRTASPPPDPTFTDARRNWTDDIEEKVHTFNVYFEVPKIAGKFDFGVTYDYTKADTTYTYGVPPDSTLTPPVQLQPTFNDWAQARVTTAYWLRRNLSLGLTYLYDQFDVNDWALGSQTLDRLAHSNTFLLMNYGWDPYTAHTVWLKATYLW